MLSNSICSQKKFPIKNFLKKKIPMKNFPENLLSGKFSIKFFVFFPKACLKVYMITDSNSNSENENNTDNNIMAQTNRDFFRLESFLDQINLLESQTVEAHTATLIKFLLTRIVGKAREALPSVVNSVDIIRESLKTHIQPDSSQVIEGKFLALNIDRNNMTKFAEKSRKTRR